MRLIDADELKEYLEEAYDAGCIDKYYNQRRRTIFDEVLDCVDEQPTVDADPVRHGRWEKVRGHQMVRRCSECGDIMPRDRAFIHYIYCGHCGARMDG